MGINLKSYPAHSNWVFYTAFPINDVALRQYMNYLAARGKRYCTCRFNHAFYATFLETLAVRDERLGSFEGQLQRDTVAKFAVADLQHIETTAQRVRRKTAQQAIDARNEHPEQDTLVRAQAKRKRKHMPPR